MLLLHLHMAQSTHCEIQKRKGLGKGSECLTVHYFLLCFQAIIHPDTGKKILMPFRMSGVLLCKKKLINLTYDCYFIIQHAFV